MGLSLIKNRSVLCRATQVNISVFCAEPTGFSVWLEIKHSEHQSPSP